MLTTETLLTLERDATNASVWSLREYIGIVRNGLAGAGPDLQTHGRHLLLKLEHLANQAQVPTAAPWPGTNDFLAPSLVIAEPLRAAA